MKRVTTILLALICAAGLMAQDEMSFVIEGSEETYNQIRVQNETSYENFSVRLVVLDDNDKISYVYGQYNLKGKGDIDSNTAFIKRGTKVGIQLAKDFASPISFNLEYIDLPIYDAIIVHLIDPTALFSSEFK